jgi:predicted P-loop ATPase
VEQWLEVSKRERLFSLYNAVGSGKLIPVDMARADALWHQVANVVFDTTDESPELIIAILKKFMWQVKRKIRGLPVFNHLMPVLLGPQGKGKSTFVNAMISPLEELVRRVDFKQIEDDRNIEIWKSYVLFLDEMGFASKANIDAIKNVITAPVLDRRPMRSNGVVTVPQNATFMGCSNKELNQLITDPTGIRRFFGLRYRADADWEFINQIDWALLWQSVETAGADPTEAFMDEIRAKQELVRQGSKVEQWMQRLKRCIGSLKRGQPAQFQPRLAW